MVRPDFWRERRVFVTGHTGFKGAWLCAWLQLLGAQVTGYALPAATNPNLEEAIRRGAFRELGKREPSQLAFIRLKPNGEVFEESILEHNRKPKSAVELSEEAWERLEQLLLHYNDPTTGYLSRALPFREGETDGDYDHLARVLEWSAGGDGSAEDDE